MTDPALIERITRSLAYMLRHQPQEFDLELDSQGWGEFDEVVRALNERLGEPVTAEDLENAVAAGDRPRYEIRDGRVRALYGHSIPVEAGEPSQPPEVLYVGLSAQDAERALRVGLSGGRRRFLHLARSVDDARDSGRRTGREYAVLAVRAVEAWEEGNNFYDRQALFLADGVPTKFLTLLDRFDDGEERVLGRREGERSAPAYPGERSERPRSDRGSNYDDRGGRHRRGRGGRGGRDHFERGDRFAPRDRPQEREPQPAVESRSEPVDRAPEREFERNIERPPERQERPFERARGGFERNEAHGGERRERPEGVVPSHEGRSEPRFEGRGPEGRSPDGRHGGRPEGRRDRPDHRGDRGDRGYRGDRGDRGSFRRDEAPDRGGSGVPAGEIAPRPAARPAHEPVSDSSFGLGIYEARSEPAAPRPPPPPPPARSAPPPRPPEPVEDEGSSFGAGV